MWIKLANNEYLNLAHVVRVRFNRGWKNGQEEVVAELESFSTKGDLQVFTRYRGVDAKELQPIFEEAKSPEAVGQMPIAPEFSQPFAPNRSTTNTVHDIQLPPLK